MPGLASGEAELEAVASDPTPLPDPGPTWWREIFDQSPDGMLIVQGDRIVFVNTALAAIVGLERQSLKGMSLGDLIPREHRAWQSRTLREATGEPPTRPMGGGMVVHLRRADGSELPVEIALVRLELDGLPTTLATVRDVTAWRAGEAERARLAQVVDLVPDSMLVVDTSSGTVVDANQAATRLLGYSEDDLRGMPVGRLAAPGGSAEEYVPEHAVLLADGGELHLQRLLTREGRVIDCEVHTSAVEDHNRRPLLVNVVRDIGERHALEQRLRESEELFRTTFEQAPVGIGLLSRNGGGPLRVVRTNRALDEMLGYGRGELVGVDVAVLRPPEDRGLQPALRFHAGMDATDLTVIRRYRRRDGSTLWAEVRVSLLDLPISGHYLLVHAVDVTTRVSAERAMRRDSVVNRFLAEVSSAALEDRPEEEILTLLADGVVEVIDAEGVAVLIVDGGDEAPGWWAGSAGQRAEDLIDVIDAAGRHDVLKTAVRGAGPVRSWRPPPAPDRPDLGPVILIPRSEGTSGGHGLVAACRAPGAPPLTAKDGDRLLRLVTHAQVAVRLARARAAQARLAVIEERQRIARDLHDTVIQDVIAVGMQISAEIDVESDPRRQVRDLEKVAQLEQATRNLRRAVFELRTAGHRASTAAEITEMVAEAAKVLGHFPVVTIAGPVDDLEPELVDDLVAASREALSNVARHARATCSSVTLSVDADTVTLVVEDDGIGADLAEVAGCYGIVNLRERARRHDGDAEVTSTPGQGTRVVWACRRERFARDE
jgi:PAS domain S-box-containing protein